MRELKFRVWSEEDRQYRTDCNVCELFNGKTGCPATIYNDEGDRFDIEQYTNLKDKNGKEIYEGDIVASGYFGEGRILKVVFYEGCFCLCETHLEIPHAGFVYYFRQGSRFRPQDDYEVIGNIHENPELLKD